MTSWPIPAGRPCPSSMAMSWAGGRASFTIRATARGRSAPCSRPTALPWKPLWERLPGQRPDGTRRQPISAQPSSSALPISSKRARPSSWRCACARRARHCPMPWVRCARQWISCAITLAKRAGCSPRPWNCPARPARRTPSRCTAAAFSPASARGIFRWPFISVRSAPPSRRAMRSSPSRPSRRRLLLAPPCACCWKPVCRRPSSPSCPATAKQWARRWWQIRASPACASPVPPILRNGFSARWPRGTASSCHSSPRPAG